MPALLEVRSLTKSFGGLRALNGISFTVEAGKILSIIGPNGAGKTTLFNVITGALPADSGDILFEGRSIKGLKPNQTAQLGIGRTFQIVRPFPGLTTLDNVTLAALAKVGTRREAQRRAEEVLEITRLSSFAKVESRNLTLARRKRLEIARAMALEPRIILLDEVMAGLTPAEVDETVALIKDLTTMGISAVAGVEHVMQAVRKISDWIVVLNFGQWLAEGRPDEVMRNREVIEAYLGRRYAEAEELRR
ncbi:MAG TPA: ABC transporter ATP-binding protein [Candidatus Acidoferrum sp.]|nr:ABC transporter ATP-binding protein [Candidatus Acidoferrum sp.]